MAIVVDQPIVNSPLEEPMRHLRDASGGVSDEHLVIEVKGLEREQDRSLGVAQEATT